MLNRLQIAYEVAKDSILFWYIRSKDLLSSSSPKLWESGEKGTVVLIPGFNEGINFLKETGNLLNEQGYRIIFPKSFGAFTGIEVLSEKILKELDERKINNFSLIGHSKGALVAKSILLRRPNSVDKIITVAAPWQGTIVGNVRVLNLSELIPNSKIIQKLGKEEAVNSRILNIRAKVDQYMHKERDTLPGARNVKIEKIGHIGVIFDKETTNLILREFET